MVMAHAGTGRSSASRCSMRRSACCFRPCQVYAPTQITLGASEATAKTVPFLVYEVAVRTSKGWRIAAIVPVAAPTPTPAPAQ
jgi:hypothetical protein